MNSMNKTASSNPLQRDIKTIVNAGLARRHAAERRFRWYGLIAVTLGLVFVVLMFGNIISKGYPAFWQTYIQVPIQFDPAVIDPEGKRDPQTLQSADYAALVRAGMHRMFPAVEGRLELRALYGLVSSAGALELQQRVLQNPELIGTEQEIWLLASANVDTLIKGNIDRSID